jgi:hypothetical protein
MAECGHEGMQTMLDNGHGPRYIAVCPCHGLMNVGHGGVPLLSLLVGPEGAAVVEPELPPRLLPLLLFLSLLPLLRQLLFPPLSLPLSGTLLE